MDNESYRPTAIGHLVLTKYEYEIEHFHVCTEMITILYQIIWGIFVLLSRVCCKI